MKRQSSEVVISAYRATSIVDTPMRKVEVLEERIVPFGMALH